MKNAKKAPFPKGNVVLPINFHTENDEMNNLFRLFHLEKKALEEKIKSLKFNDIEFWEAKIQGIIVNLCIKQGTFSPSFDIEKAGILKALEHKLNAIGLKLKTELDELNKAKLRYDKLLTKYQISNKQLVVMLYSIPESTMLSYQTEIKNRLVDKINEYGISASELTEFKKELYEVEEFINGLHKKHLNYTEKRERLEYLKSLEVEVLDQMLNSLNKNCFTAIELINKRLEIAQQRAEIEQIEESILSLDINNKTKSIIDEKLSLEEGDIRLNEEISKLTDYLKLVEDKYRYYNATNTYNDIEAYEKARNLYQLANEISAKKEFIYFFSKRREIVKKVVNE